MTKLVTNLFSDTSFLDASLSVFAAWPLLPLVQVVFPCQVPVDAAQSEARNCAGGHHRPARDGGGVLQMVGSSLLTQQQHSKTSSISTLVAPIIQYV